MLVLSRKVNEQIFIGENIRITILKSGRSGIRLGIEAPREVGVVRGELADNKQAHSSTPLQGNSLQQIATKAAPFRRVHLTRSGNMAAPASTLAIASRLGRPSISHRESVPVENSPDVCSNFAAVRALMLKRRASLT